MSEDSPDPASLRGWFAGRLPQDWFLAAPTVEVDREEITVIGALTPPDLPADAPEGERRAARAGRAKAFREATRAERMAIADESSTAPGARWPGR